MRLVGTVTREAHLKTLRARRRKTASDGALAVSVALTMLLAAAPGVAATRPEGALPDRTQDLHGQVLNPQNQTIAGALCTLTGGMLPQEGLSVTSDEQGNFGFPGIAPATYTLICTAVGYEPVARTGLEVTAESNPALTFVLPAEVVVRQRVEVRAKVPTASEQGAAPPSELKARELRSLPLGVQWFKTALPLVPGVVRTPDGRISVKGEVENQGLLLVDSAEMVDPVTGAFSIQIPVDAVESLSVYKTTPLADYGRFSGGLTTIDTKAPSGRFRYELNDFLPTPRIKSGHIVGIADDEPR
ncbi:MAG TPA: carboxypeptidase regulatory-like domain-containing protein, partial [Terriglobia bacterium]|nr:carboxypeptidase regulatory-like domain-containing protein [Terriglobia bacterium]